MQNALVVERLLGISMTIMVGMDIFFCKVCSFRFEKCKPFDTYYQNTFKTFSPEDLKEN